MVRALHVQVGEAAVTVQEFNAVVLVTELDAALAVQLDARPFVQPKAVIVQMHAHLEVPRQINAGDALAGEVNGGLEAVAAVVDLNAVPQGGRSHRRLGC